MKYRHLYNNISVLRGCIVLYFIGNVWYILTGSGLYRTLGLSLSLVPVLILKIDRTAAIAGFISLLLGILFSFKMIIYNELYLLGYIPIFSSITGVCVYISYKESAQWTLILFNTILDIFLIYCVYHIYILEGPTNEIVYYSRNTVTTLIISLFVVTYICYKSKRDETIYKCLFIGSVVLSVLVCANMGRTGIMVASGILGIGVYDIIRSSIIVSVVVILLLIYTFITIQIEDIINIFPALSRLEEMGAEGPRWYIWSSVLNEVDSIKHMFGLPRDMSIVLTGFSWHNGFLHAYSMYGILGVCIIVYFISYIIIISMKYSMPLAMLFGVLAARVFFDDVLISPFVVPVIIVVALMVIDARNT